MTGRVLFLSWCPLDLLRPRAIQVGRTAKALATAHWQVDLVCASFDLALEDDLVDAELATLHHPAFNTITSVPDPYFGPPRAARIEPAGRATRWLRRMRPVPPPPVPWVDGVVPVISQSLRTRPPDLLVSFGQPWASHMAALRLKREMPHLRWIAHFSDPWAKNPYHSLGAADIGAMQADERQVVESANALVFVTRQTADLVMAEYAPALAEKIEVIPHLLDEELAADIQARPRSDGRLRIVHVGSLYNGRRAPAALVHGLRRLLDAGITPADVEFRFIGDMPQQLIGELETAGLAGFVRFTPPLYYLPSLKEMATADVLLAIDADFEESPFLPSKVIDYLMLDRPMAALTPAGGATGDLMRRLDYPVCRPSDAEGFVRLVGALLEQCRSADLAMSPQHRELRAGFGIAAGGRMYDAIFRRVMATVC